MWWAREFLARVAVLPVDRLADALEAHDAEKRRSEKRRRAPEFPAPCPTATERITEPRLGLTHLRSAGRWFETLARAYGIAVDLNFRRPSPAEPDARSAPVDEEVARLLTRLQRLLVKYPVAAQAAFSALVAEGRAFARTEEGAKYDAKLRTSRALSRSWLILERVSSRMLVDRDRVVLPSTYIDAIFQGAELQNLSPLFARLFGSEEQ